MMNNSKQLVKIISQSWKKVINQHITYQYSSKLSHFCNYYPFEYQFIQKIEINKYQRLLDEITFGNSFQFNIRLTQYLMYEETNINELLTILEKIYYESVHCSKINKEKLIKYINEQEVINSDVINIIQITFALGIAEKTIFEQFNKYFLQINLNELSNSSLFDCLLILMLAKRKLNINLSQQQEIIKWKQLIQLINNNLSSNDKTYQNKYAQFIFNSKHYLTNDDNDESAIINDVKTLYKDMTKQFLKEVPIQNISGKDQTTILMSLIKLREQIIMREQNHLIIKICNNLLEYDFQKLNDYAIQSLVSSVQFLKEYRKALGEKILLTLKYRILNGIGQVNCQVLMLYDIYFKWATTFSKDYLISVIGKIQIEELNVYELNQFFSLITLLPISQICQIMIQVEQDLLKSDEIVSLQDCEPYVAEKIIKTLDKLNLMIQNSGQSENQIEKIKKLIS